MRKLNCDFTLFSDNVTSCDKRKIPEIEMPIHWFDIILSNFWGFIANAERFMKANAAKPCVFTPQFESKQKIRLMKPQVSKNSSNEPNTH